MKMISLAFRRRMRTISQNLRILGRSPAFWLLGGATLAAVGANLTASDGNPNPPIPALLTDKTAPARKTIREGARIESQAVQARTAGDKMLLEVEGENKTYEGLENLALQRIAQALQEDSSDSRWIVSGQITEFRDQNFLLLERVLRAPAQIK